MSTHASASKMTFIAATCLLGGAVSLLSSCNQGQEMAMIKETFDRQLKQKDQELADMKNQLNVLTEQANRSKDEMLQKMEGNVDRVAVAVSEKVSASMSKQLEDSFKGLKDVLGDQQKKIEAALAAAQEAQAAALKAQQAAVAQPPPQVPQAQPNVPQPSNPTGTSSRSGDPNVKRFRLDF